MPATVLSSNNMVEFVTTGKVEKPAEFPVTTRERIRIKREGKPAEAAKPEAKVEESKPKVESAKSDADDAKKLDDAPKPDVKAKSAEPSAKPNPDEPSEEDLPERARKVIGKKHRQMKEAEEFAALQRSLRLDAEKKVKDLETELESLRKGKPAKQDSDTSRAEDSDEPKPEDFPNVAAYAKAQIKWEREQERKQQTEAAAKKFEAEDTERRSKSQAAWKQRLDAVMEETPEYEDLVSKAFADSPKVAMTVLDAIEESELGPQMLLHLAKHPAERATFLDLKAEGQIKYLGKLEAKLEAKLKRDPEPEPEPKKETPKPEAKAEPPTKNVSKAPPPADTSVGSAEVEKDPSKMSFQEYRAYMDSKRKSRSK